MGRIDRSERSGSIPDIGDNSVISEFTVQSSQCLQKTWVSKSEILVLEHAALLLNEHLLQGKETLIGVNVPEYTRRAQPSSADLGELLAA